MGFHSWYPILTHGETGDVATDWMFWTKIKLYCAKLRLGFGKVGPKCWTPYNRWVLERSVSY